MLISHYLLYAMRAFYLLLLMPTLLSAQTRARGRALGIPFPGRPGTNNAITDVPGVAVGHVTIIRGAAGPVVAGQGPVRTGVTAILPHGGNLFRDKVPAAISVGNGFGKFTGALQCANWAKSNRRSC